MKEILKIEYAVNTAKANVSKAMNAVRRKNTIIQESTEGIDNPDASVMNKIIDNITNNYKLPSVKLTPTGFGVGEPSGTFFYGYPRFIDGEIPTDSSGKQLRFMAQINCEDLKSLPDYPHTGILQFWVQTEKYKIFLDINDPRAYQVIYIENPHNNNIDNVELDETVYQQDCGDFPNIWLKDYNYSDNLLLSPSSETLVPTPDDSILLKIIKQEIMNATGNQYTETSESDKKLLHDIMDTIWDDKRFKSSWGNRVGGYPSFTQSGPDGRDTMWDTLLLQLDSSKDVVWGDNGIASFYISHDNLVKRDFNTINFYWDCY